MSVLGPLGSVRFDTGLELELLTAGLSPLTSTRTRPPVAELDNRRDNKGPEPEGVDIGEVGGRSYAFLAAERQAGCSPTSSTAPAPISRPTPIPGRPT